MKINEMGPFRRQLLELGRRLKSDVDTLADETFQQTAGKPMGSLSNMPVEDRAERGSDDFDEEVTISLLEKEGPRLGEINAALERIDKGAFGRCEDCGKEISRKRLQAIPLRNGASKRPQGSTRGRGIAG